jgi:hypothetical protein
MPAPLADLDNRQRPTRADLVAILRQALNPEVPINVDGCMYWISPDYWATQPVLVNGWTLEIIWHGCNIDHLRTADAPQGLHWSYGCDRWPSWEAGPDSVPLCPIRHLLTAAERQALEARLQTIPCKPPAEPSDPVAPSVDEIMDQQFMELMTA